MWSASNSYYPTPQVGELVQVISTLPPAAAVAQFQESVVLLAEATVPEETSILPGDLATTSEVLADQLDLLIQMGLNQTADVDALINDVRGWTCIQGI